MGGKQTMPIAALPLIGAGVSAVGAGIAGGQQRAGMREAAQAPYAERPGAQQWASQMAQMMNQGGDFQLPSQVGQMGGVLGGMMQGQLTPGAQQMMTTGAGQMFRDLMGGARSGVAGRGGGLEALQGLRQRGAQQVTGLMAPQMAQMQEQARMGGVGGMGAFTKMMALPQEMMAQRKRDIAGLYMGTPGAAYLNPGQKLMA